MDELLQAALNSIATGSLYALAAVGLTLVYGVLRLTNFAHGDMLTLGAYTGYAVNVMWNLPLALAFLAAPIVVAAFAVGTEYVIWRPMRGRGAGLLQKLLMAIGLALVLRYAIQFVFGGSRDNYDYPQRYSNTGTVDWLRDWFGLTLGYYDALTIVLGVLVLVTVALVLSRTLLGTSMRAMSDDVDLAESSGIDTNRTVVWTWVLAGALVGVGGVLAGATNAIYPSLGWELLLTTFACVIVGGIGSAYGALLGSYVIAFSQEFLVLFVNSSYKTTIGFVIMVIVLLIRPNGIMGQRRAVN